MSAAAALWLAAAALAVAASLGALAWVRSRRLERLLALTRDKLEEVQRQFEQFVPPDVVEQLTAAHGTYTPKRTRVTMLFADLLGVTALCDRLDPAVTVGILNEYFRRMNSVIGRHHDPRLPALSLGRRHQLLNPRLKVRSWPLARTRSS